MAETESITGSIVFLVVSLVVLAVVFIGVSKYQETTFVNDYSQYNNEKNFEKFETLLTITDMYSRKPMTETIGISLLKGGMYSTIYGNVSIQNSLKHQFDFLYGEGNYFLSIEPKIDNIKLFFLYDAGEFMLEIAEEKNFADEITATVNYFNQEGVKIDPYVYILGNNSEVDLCEDYNDFAKCIKWYHQDLYNLEFLDPVYLKYPLGNKSLYMTDVYYPNDWATYIARVAQVHGQQKSVIKSDLIIIFSDVVSLGGPVDEYFTTSFYEYYNPDFTPCDDSFYACFDPKADAYYACIDVLEPFATCMDTAYNEVVACYDDVYADQVDCYNRGTSPSTCDRMADDGYKECEIWYETDVNTCYLDLYETSEYDSCLSSTGVGVCYDEDMDCRIAIVEEDIKVSAGNSYYLYYCPLNEDFTTSDFTVNRSIEYLKSKDKYIYPVVVRNNNIEESDYERECITKYISEIAPEKALGSELNGGDSTTLCGKAGCEGCYEDASGGIFHKETRDKHISQVTAVANATGGEVITFNDDTQIYELLKETIEAILSKTVLTVGEKKSNTYTQNFQKKQIVSVDGETVLLDMNLEVYPDINYQVEPQLEFRPVVSSLQKSPISFDIAHNEEITSLKVDGNVVTYNIVQEKTLQDLVYYYSVSTSITAPIDAVLNFEYEDSTGSHTFQFK